MTKNSYSHTILDENNRTAGKLIINSIEGVILIANKEGETLEEMTRDSRGNWIVDVQGHIWTASSKLAPYLNKIGLSKIQFDNYLNQQGILKEFYSGKEIVKKTPTKAYRP